MLVSIPRTPQSVGFEKCPEGHYPCNKSYGLGQTRHVRGFFLGELRFSKHACREWDDKAVVVTLEA